jgi:hypothetical protein
LSLQQQPPASWYDDPEQPGMLRYWDGESWTDQTMPSTAEDAPVPPEIPAEEAGTGYAWALALTPVAWLLVDVAMLLLGIDGVAVTASNAAFLGLNLALAKGDSAALEASGVRVSAWWGFFLVPVYLILRTVRARSTAAVPILWFVLVAVYVVALFAMPPTAAQQRDAWAESVASYGCEELTDEAITMSQDGKERLALSDIRNARVVEDNTATFELPSAGDEVMVLACRGLGVWADDGTTSRLRLELTLNSEGEAWIAFNPVDNG